MKKQKNEFLVKTSYDKLPANAQPIPGFPTYYATPEGEIWRISAPRKTPFALIPSRIIKIVARKNDKTPYYHVQPFKNGKKVNVYLHRLVLMTFKGLPVGDRKECHHIDHNPSNNHIDNLVWVNRSENCRLRKSRKHNLDNN